MKIDISKCKKSDIILLNRYIAGPNCDHIKHFLKQQEGKSIYLIAWKECIPVGHLDLIFSGNRNLEIKKHLKNTPELYAISVWPSKLRSKGIGRKLIKEAEKLAKKMGFKQVFLGVEINNLRAKELYERLDYKDWGYGTYIDSYLGKDKDGKDKKYKEECYCLIKKLNKNKR